MNVGQLIEKLSQFPKGKEVIVTEGFQGETYRGDFTVELFQELDGSSFVDIGIGGLNL